MDDDHVAQILAREAKESSMKYASQGLSALMPSKPASNAPKPNTRFLRNLIKVTDSHNTALKKKEEKDARERMRQLKSQASGASASRSIERTSGQSRNRNRSADSRDHRREHKEDRYRSDRRRHRSRSTSAEEDKSKRHRRGDDYSEVGQRHRRCDSQRRGSHARESSKKDQEDRGRETTRRRRDRSYSDSRSRSPRRDRSIDRHRHRRQSRRSGHHTSSRSREREHRKSRSSGHADSSSRRSRHGTSFRRDHAPPPTTVPTEAGEESDPLEELVGPLPPRQNEVPIRSRGRGAYKPNTSNIDAHFAPGYDPTTDVHLEDDPTSTGGSSRRPVAGLMTKDDDWDMALEALQDRARWKQKGEERLRAAGINETTINQWKNNTAFTGTDGEGKAEDVQWSKKGEGREWDRGKFVDDDGHIDIRAAW